MSKKLSEIYDAAPVVPINNSSRIVFMSDCHRGDGSWADNLAQNRSLYSGALDYYYHRGYTYIEIGDGDELWENSELSDIIYAHKDALRLLAKFYAQGRLYMIYGNHDMVKKDAEYVRANLCCIRSGLGATEPLFEKIKVHEALRLRHAEAGRDIFLVHGHQMDFFNYKLWKLARFLVRHFWKPLEAFGAKDPTSAARNNKRSKVVENRLAAWCKSNDRMMIAGHTHRPVFPEADEPLYFNDGSCVHPRCITAIEIADGSIMLVKWCISTMQGGILYVKREIIAGPEKLAAYLSP